MSKISVVINTYNAAATLAKTLESAKDFDEVVVCDMESTDNTRNIADEFGCRFITYPKGDSNICEVARDFAIHSAANEWVLVLDADEAITSELREFLYAHTEKKGAEEGVFIPRINFIFGQEDVKYPDYQLRFFKQSLTFWPPTIHTRPEVTGRIKRIPASRRNLAIVHRQQTTYSEYIDKLNAYSDNEVAKRQGEKVSLFKFFFWPAFHFFRSYILKGGIFAGKYGYVSARLAYTYKLFTLIKLWEAQNKKNED